MSDVVWVAVVGAVPATIGAIATLRATRQINRVEENTNSITTRLESVARVAGHGEGVAQERTEARGRLAEPIAAIIPVVSETGDPVAPGAPVAVITPIKSKAPSA